MTFNSNDRIFTQVFASALMTRSPNYEFTDVILSDVFPKDISYNSVGSTKFSTDVVMVDSGNDQRIQRWEQPLMEYDISYGVRTMEDLQALIGFFRAMRGRLYAFNYFDHVDGYSSTAVTYESRSVPAPTPYDQVLGIGDGVTYQFQLTKTYQSLQSYTTQVRTITRPVPGTVTIGVGGVQVTNFTVDTTTGIVTFTSPEILTVSASISKDAQTGSYGSTFTGAAGSFSGILPYAGHLVIISGFSNGLNNAPLASPAFIESVTSDGSSCRIQYPLATGTAGSVAESASGVTFTVHPAPLTTQTVTAGFQFYVPVRFDTDILPTTLEYYGIGSANSIKLVEVRPNSW